MREIENERGRAEERERKREEGERGEIERENNKFRPNIFFDSEPHIKAAPIESYWDALFGSI